MPKFKDFTQVKIGKLLVESVHEKNKNGIFWKCTCDCGKTTIVSSRNLSRKNNPTGSCGCLLKESIKNNNPNYKHGKSKTKEHRIWRGIIDRCTNPNNKNYKHYGGRGVSITNEWVGKNGFENFLKDMGICKEKDTIERIDNEKGYSKENCKWATIQEQSMNKRTSLFVRIQGQTKCLAEWCRILELSYFSIHGKYRANSKSMVWLEKFLENEYVLKINN